MDAEVQRALSELEARGRLRALMPRIGHDFTSNDYLGLAESTLLQDAVRAALDRGVPAGAGGSRLLRGNHPEHQALEEDAAAHYGAEAALFFASGFLANYAIFSTLPQRGDLVVHDVLIHASAHDGLRAGRAERAQAQHNDTQSFADEIAHWRRHGGRGRIWIAVESLYSMDGDRAPLQELIELADRHQAMLVIDEAHATGVFGPDGRGLGAHLEGRQNVITLHTCGKALGAVGALVCTSAAIRDFLVNRCRPFIYATAPSPLMAATVREALRICRCHPERRQRLQDLYQLAARELERRCAVAPSGSQILPVIVGQDERAVRLAAALRRAGFDVRAIRPPTVPEGTARLRLAVTLNVDADVIHHLVSALADAMAEA